MYRDYAGTFGGLYSGLIGVCGQKPSYLPDVTEISDTGPEILKDGLEDSTIKIQNPKVASGCKDRWTWLPPNGEFSRQLGCQTLSNKSKEATKRLDLYIPRLFRVPNFVCRRYW